MCQLLFYLNLSPRLSNSSEKVATWHRNCCIVLGCVAEKLAGPNSVATFKPTTLDYLLANLVFKTLHLFAFVRTSIFLPVLER